MCTFCSDVARELGRKVHLPYLIDLAHGVAHRRDRGDTNDPQRPPNRVECGAAWFVVAHWIKEAERMPEGARRCLHPGDRLKALFRQRGHIKEMFAGERLSVAQRNRIQEAVAKAALKRA